MINLGQGRWRSFWNSIVLLNKQKIILYYFYSLESNIRWASILGAVGISGYGQMFNLYSGTRGFGNLSITLLFLAIIIGLLELFSFIYNTFVEKIRILDSDNIKFFWFKKNIQRIFWWIFVFINTGLLIWSLISFQFTQLDLKQFKIVFFEFFSGKSHEEVNWFNYLSQMFLNSIYILISSAAISLLIGYFMAENINNKAVSFFLKIWCLILRIIPTVMVFSILNLLGNTEFILVWVLIISQVKSNAKKISETFNNVNMTEVKYLRLLGYGKTKLFFEYILPTFKKDLFSIFFFSYEQICRAWLVYSVLVPGNTVGSTFAFLKKNDFLSDIFVLLMPFYVYFIAIEVLYYCWSNQVLWKIWKNIEKYGTNVKILKIK
ncbi:ABC transporter permease subunit [Mycoplasma sp. Ms02]|uniref:ABC transporter permease subunit n=1 Tax=Mycoplasma sp. Ms02 TaxID=353851 RepID=UPI001C899EAB|nr:ABC transporter permease subunit [Mycoplasma sp. Ms02]QZE12288.1 ABC transporter permease subunit [Mycoplasma sp. Ms02]